MIQLTPKQEAFAVAYVETGNATEAYRRAYKPTSTNEATLNRTAKGLVDNPKIAARVAALRAPAARRAQITLQSHLEKLEDLRDAALAAKKYAAAIQAEIARGKASGVAVEKSEMRLTMTGLAERMRRQRGEA